MPDKYLLLVRLTGELDEIWPTFTPSWNGKGKYDGQHPLDSAQVEFEYGSVDHWHTWHAPFA
jgi:hypothetical protein